MKQSSGVRTYKLNMCAYLECISKHITQCTPHCSYVLHLFKRSGPMRVVSFPFPLRAPHVHRTIKRCSQSKYIHLAKYSDPQNSRGERIRRETRRHDGGVDVGLECCCGVCLQMTVKYIFSSLKLLHHREFQYRPSGTEGYAFHVFSRQS